MSYRVLSARSKNVTPETFAASESRAFSALGEAMAWAAAGRANFSVVVVEEGRGRPVSVRSPEDAARSVV